MDKYSKIEFTKALKKAYPFMSIDMISSILNNLGEKQWLPAVDEVYAWRMGGEPNSFYYSGCRNQDDIRKKLESNDGFEIRPLNDDEHNLTAPTISGWGEGVVITAKKQLEEIMKSNNESDRFLLALRSLLLEYNALLGYAAHTDSLIANMGGNDIILPRDLCE